MKISVFGLGYVGLVSAVCLAHEGHEVWGVDINPIKVHMIKAGKSPIIEAYVEDRLAEQVRDGRLMATVDPTEAVCQSELSLICVGTPSTVYGALDLTQVEQVCKHIGTALRDHTSAPHTVVFRSTMLPGSTQHLMQVLATHSGRVLGQGLHVAYNPEFLREGTAVQDFYAPPYTVIGTTDPIAATTLQALYSFLSAPICILDIAEAELVKYACNAFHATKITFANEIGRLAQAWHIDGTRVMDLLCQDTSLNISPAYLRPGFAYGGSCLPKDLRALVWQARLSNVHVPQLESLAVSNDLQIERAYQIVTQAVKGKVQTIGFLGLTFKAGTDDLRESPTVELVERLIGKGYRLLLYDENVSLDRLIGTNKEFVEQEIPHLAELLTADIDRVLQESNVVVVCRQCPQYAEVLRRVPHHLSVLYLEAVLSGHEPSGIGSTTVSASEGPWDAGR
jgi:GDP-mannose 6-dehydrogenase